MNRVISWFSCGVTSAIATKEAINRYPNCIPVYCDTGSEHPDNKRFIADCERWFKRPIMVLQSKKFKNIWEVFDQGYLVGVNGAPCTTQLKKLVRREFEHPDDLQIFGFDVNEKHRAENFKGNNPEVNCEFPLIELGLSKKDCLNFMIIEGIKLPMMYRLGFHNNNCIGCVKGGAGYWNKIRKVFPETFDRMAKLERRLGVTILKDRRNKSTKRLYLDELEPGFGKHEDLQISCGLFCGEI